MARRRRKGYRRKRRGQSRVRRKKKRGVMSKVRALQRQGKPAWNLFGGQEAETFTSAKQVMANNGLAFAQHADVVAMFSNHNKLEGPTGAEAVAKLDWISGNVSHTLLTQKMWVGSWKIDVTFRNNYAAPVEMYVYWIVPKRNLVAAHTPSALVTNGLDRLKGSNAADELDTLYYPTDSRDFNNHYRIKNKCHVVIPAGEEMRKTYRIPARKFSLAEVSRNATELVHNIRNYSGNLFIRQFGMLSHESDQVTNDLNWHESAIDVYAKFRVKYAFPWNAGLSRSLEQIGAEFTTLTTPAIRHPLVSSKVTDVQA